MELAINILAVFVGVTVPVMLALLFRWQLERIAIDLPPDIDPNPEPDEPDDSQPGAWTNDLTGRVAQ